MTTRTLTVTLAFPLTWGEATIKTVTLTRPKTKHLEALAGLAAGDEADEATKTRAAVGTLAILSDLPEGAVGELELEDFETLSEALAGFFPQATA